MTYTTKSSSEWSKFLRFYLYFCRAVLMNCYFFCTTKLSDFLDMAKF